MSSDLREYQERCLSASTAAKDRGVLHQIIAMATGLGKTTVAAHLIKRELERQPGRALFLAPLEEIVTQSARRIQLEIPERSIGIVKARLNQIYSDVIVGSVPTITREGRLKQLGSDFSTLIVDECHLNLDGYKKIVDRLAAEGALIVGLSATPYRLDGRGLEEVFEEIVFEMGIYEGIQQQYLVDIESFKFVLQGADFTKVHTRKGDLEAKELEAVMQASNFDEHITRKWLEMAADRHTVIFLPKVAMAYQLAAHMRTQGIRAEAVDGTEQSKENRSRRRDILARYDQGDIQVLCNVLCLGTGWDSPKTDCIVMARPSKSKALIIQTLGRGLRPYPPVKRNCLYLDMVGATEREDLFSLASLAGVAAMKDGESFSQAKLRGEVEARDKEREKQAEADRQQRLETELAARRVYLFGSHDPGFDSKFQKKQAYFHWVIDETNNQRSLHLDDRTVLVRPMPDDSWIARDGQGWTFIGESAECCQKQAEEFAKDLQKKKKILRDRSAPWRSEPATDKQLYNLRRWKIRHDPFEITRGEAADLMDEFMARKKGAVA